MKKRRVVLSRSGVTSSVVYHLVNSANKEDKSNKVSQFSEVPDNEHYPTEKLLFDEITKESNRAQNSEKIITGEIEKCQKIGSYVWGKNSNINSCIFAGVYYIHGERLSQNDGLPIDNYGPGNTISGKLNVIDSSPNTTNLCITQILELSNSAGGDTNIYTRTGTSNDSYGNIVWSPWQKLQGIVNIPLTTSFDNYIDNGMYSGIQAPSGDMFMLIVLNNYAVVASVGQTRSVAQIKFSLSLNGGFSLHKRVGRGNETISWGEWSTI